MKTDYSELIGKKISMVDSHRGGKIRISALVVGAEYSIGITIACPKTKKPLYCLTNPSISISKSKDKNIFTKNIRSKYKKLFFRDIRSIRNGLINVSHVQISNEDEINSFCPFGPGV